MEEDVGKMKEARENWKKTEEAWGNGGGGHGMSGKSGRPEDDGRSLESPVLSVFGILSTHMCLNVKRIN